MDEKTISVAGAIPNAQAMQDLVEALEKEGFEHAQFGLLTSEEHYEGFLELAAKPENEGSIEGTIIGGLTYVGAVTGLGVAIFGGGGLGVALVALAGAGGGGGGALAGVLAAAGFHHAHAEKISEELARGRLVAWIAPRGPGQSDLARTLLTSAGAAEILECDLMIS
jgi:hypothetical protein